MTEKNDDWRSRLERNRDSDREQIEGFFQSRRGRIFVFVALGIFAVAVLWNVGASIISSIFGGGA